MSPNLRKVLLFGLQFLPLFLALLWLYPKLLPMYQHGVVGLANPLLESLSPPMHIVADSKGGWQVYLLQFGDRRRLFFTVEGDYLNLIYLNLALLPALLLATPVSIKQRMLILAWGLVLLFALHAVSAIGFVRAEVCSHYNPRNLFCNWLEGIIGTGGQIFAVVLWGLLTWRYWFPKPVSSTSALQQRKVKPNDPCPCGSGKKYKRCCGKKP